MKANPFKKFFVVASAAILSIGLLLAAGFFLSAKYQDSGIGEASGVNGYCM